jgi:hypothetical protein
MNRLKKLVEIGQHEERSGRVVYVLRPETLPEPRPGWDWLEDGSFNAADAILADGGLKSVFSAAIAQGFAVVEPDSARPKSPSMRASIFTVEIDGKPIVSFEAKNTKEALELTKEDWFLDDLQALKTDGQVLWNGTALVRPRLATEPEVSRYRAMAAEAAEENGDILLAFLVTLDDARVPR